MNIKALPSVGNAFFVAFVLWSRRFAVPLQKESLGGASGVHLSQVHQQSKKYTNRARSAPPELHQQSKKYTHRARSAPPELHQQSKKYTSRATLVHLRQVHPLKAPPEDTNKTLKQMT